MEFVDPGPDQPYPAPAAPHAPRRSVSPRRETLGLVVMLVAAALLPLLASFQTFYTVREEGAAGRYEYSVDAWGRYGELAAGARPAVHAPRFGALLLICAGCFAVLALIAASRLLGGRATEPARTATGLAGAAAGVLGLLTGVTAAMTLEIGSVFDSLRAGSGSPFGIYQVRMRIGGAVWISVAGILAGGLGIAAALRVRRASVPAPLDRVATATPDLR
jgi:hypothetical protein